MGADERARAGRELTARLLDLPELRGVDTLAAYVSFGTEPPTHDALRALARRGVRVLLPVLLPDRDLAWAAYSLEHPPPADPPRLWTAEPPWLPVEAVADAQVAVVPAVAVGADGTRLGRGGGSYDRVLARLGPQPVLTLLYAPEVLPAVPAEPHDQRVTVAVTPDAVHRFGPRERAR